MTELNWLGLLAVALGFGVAVVVYLFVDASFRARGVRASDAYAKNGFSGQSEYRGHLLGLLFALRAFFHFRRWPHRVGLLFVSRLAPNPSLLERLQLAGLRSFPSEADWFGLRVCLALVASGICLVVAFLLKTDAPTAALWAMLGLAVGYVYPALWLGQKAQVQVQKARTGFPAFLDGLALSLEAGQSFAQAFAEASQRGYCSDPAPWRLRLVEFAADIRSGVARSEAARRLQQRIPVNVVDQFTALVTAAESSGLSMARVLRAQSSQARRQFQMEIEERAMKAPVKLMGPLVICIFPCTFIVLLAPLAVRLSESLGMGV